MGCETGCMANMQHTAASSGSQFVLSKLKGTYAEGSGEREAGGSVAG
ncbi:MAG: hypothetical protein M5U34_45265 [Chloroflexi bacterium]|nr:hypothetical protein [Chloroflexota bacterium]